MYLGTVTGVSWDLRIGGEYQPKIHLESEHQGLIIYLGLGDSNATEERVDEARGPEWFKTSAILSDIIPINEITIGCAVEYEYSKKRKRQEIISVKNTTGVAVEIPDMCPRCGEPLDRRSDGKIYCGAPERCQYLISLELSQLLRRAGAKIGEAKIGEFLKKYNIRSVSEISPHLTHEYLTSIKGFGKKTADSFIEILGPIYGTKSLQNETTKELKDVQTVGYGTYLSSDEAFKLLSNFYFERIHNTNASTIPTEIAEEQQKNISSIFKEIVETCCGNHKETQKHEKSFRDQIGAELIGHGLMLPFEIEYVKASGETSVRKIDLYSVVSVGSDLVLSAYCHLRCSYRTFYASRIKRIVDLSTGEETSDAIRLIKDYGIIGKDAPTTLLPSLHILIYIAKADRDFADGERWYLSQYVKQKAPLYANKLIQYAENKKVTLDLYRREISKLDQFNARELVELVKSIHEIVLIDKTIAVQELKAFEYLGELVQKLPNGAF